jgi:hypothetical protein
MKPGKDATFPSNLFNTWLDYRESLGFSRAEVIREVNQKLKKNYYNERFYKWKKQIATVPSQVLKDIVEPELPQALRWFFSQQGFPMREIDFDALAQMIIAPDMTNVLRWFFEHKGYPTRKVNFETLAEAVKPAVASKEGDQDES